MMNEPDLSLVIPVHNEAGNIGPLLDEVRAAFAGARYEVVLVDDCSADASCAEIRAKMAAAPELRLLRHQKRAGKSRALVTAFRAARGRWVMTLDGDGQNDPADLARMWASMAGKPTTAIVAGVRKRRNDGPVKWATSRVANFVRRRLLRDDCSDSGCGVKLMPTKFARDIPYFDNLHRFLPALARRAGLNVVEHRIEDRPRQHGVSKYGFFDRAAVAFLDVMGVFWLIRRYSDPGDAPEIGAVDSPGDSPEDSAAGGA
jgi:dolichol-phosphate mannosyltransferase